MTSFIPMKKKVWKSAEIGIAKLFSIYRSLDKKPIKYEVGAKKLYRQFIYRSLETVYTTFFKKKNIEIKQLVLNVVRKEIDPHGNCYLNLYVL